MNKKFPRLDKESVHHLFLEKGDVACIPNAPRRAPIYRGEVDNYAYAFKFVGETEAQDHVNNTQLFDFFELPFVPCYDMPIADLIQENPATMFFYTQHSYHTHLVVMPFVHQNNLKDIKKCASLEPKNMNALNTNILSYYTELVLSYCADFYERNILVEADPYKGNDFNKKKPITVNPGNFTFIDADDGRMSRKYRSIHNNANIKTITDLLNSTYADPLKDEPSLLNAIQENTAVTCDRWRKAISNNFPKSFQAKRRGMKENMLHNLDDLEVRLKLPTPEFFSY